MRPGCARSGWSPTTSSRPRSTATSPRRTVSAWSRHHYIFRGLEELLPTFNSIAIETLLWRIEGMSDCFILFNDDMFLAHAANPGDFFKENKVVFRGHHVDWSAAALRAHHRIAQKNAATIADIDLARVFTPAHVPHPLFRPAMKALYDRYYLPFLNNAALRFRTNTRVHPVSLFNHEMVARKRAVIRSRKRTTYVGTSFCETAPAEELRARMDLIERPAKLAFCVNGFGALVQQLPDTIERMERLVGPVQPWERASTVPTEQAIG